MSDTKHVTKSTINWAQVGIGAAAAYNLYLDVSAGGEITLTPEQSTSIAIMIGALFTIIRRVSKEHKKCHF